MDVFKLSESLIGEYQAFSRSFVDIRAEDLQRKVDEGYATRRFWPVPLLQINPHYKDGGSLQELGAAGALHRETSQIFRDFRAPSDAADRSLKLRRHQTQAVQIALDGKSYVVTTGTGSGKSLCFFIPIVDAVLKAKDADPRPRTRAIVIYPMNALANSQMEELKKFLGTDGRVTFARYTGQEKTEEREKIRDRPPDILLTNFMMLELLMTRQNQLDQRVLANCRGLGFVVLDELHTYRGRQGADVAMLMRRLRARVCDPLRPPVCIGTSATMSSADDEAERNRVVADVASRIFGTEIGPDAVVTETLQRATDPARSADNGLDGLDQAVARALDAASFIGKSNAALAADPLAIWVETRIGLKNVERKPERGRPVSVADAADLLSKESGVAAEDCRQALRQALLAYSRSEKERGVAGGSDEPLFAFRLHQLISGAGRLYATLDPAGERSVTFDGQKFDPDHPDKRLFATHFCRRCGQEHHPVFLLSEHGVTRFEAREIDDVPAEGEDDPSLGSRSWGFLMPEPADADFAFGGTPEDYPEPWQETARSGAIRLKPSYRRSQATLRRVAPDGQVGGDGVRAWFLPGRFKFCPTCGDYHTDSTRDINRLASLSAEGRSSATTILIASILRWMQNQGENALDPRQRKLLAFTDNRQDAALQAGHFNDFIFVTLLRGAILAALQAAGPAGIGHDQVGLAVQNALGFVAANRARRADWMIDPTIKGAGLLDSEKAVREGLAHRFWIDQRRGWRFTNPNLEQLGLLDVAYSYLDEMCDDDEEFEACAPLAAASHTERTVAARTLLDYMRRGLAVEADALDRTVLEGLIRRMRATVKAPWAISDDRARGATTLILDPPPRREIKLRDEPLLLRGSARSVLGRELRKLRFAGSVPDPKALPEIIETLIAACARYGLLVAKPAAIGGSGWRLNANVIVFRAVQETANGAQANRFFRELYVTIGKTLQTGGEALFGFEGREHTAQVDPELRQFREARFRDGDDDRKLLLERKAELVQLGEDDRRLPTLFCSPTMELGVDISTMNVVYLRNMPPTPANYVQRSGRAGRSGQAALIVAYCAAQSPHDQYFFANPTAMVAGVVKAPTIDLANQDLVDSHLHAEWLAATEEELRGNIPENLDMGGERKPLAKSLEEAVSAPAVTEAAAKAMQPVLSSLDRFLTDAPWFSGIAGYAETAAANAAARFDATFDRWRQLFEAAEKQRDDADRVLRDFSITEFARKAAQERLRQAHNQISLLLGGSANAGSDFYVYRYLATEGFLPGYNFPRLPLMAFIPGVSDQTRDRYLQRPRFLAIAEFGPGSLVYHEGRAYRVDRAMLGSSGTPDGKLVTFAASICPACGAGHDEETREACHVCGHPLAAAHLTRDLFRVDNVATRPIERITANDEERRRQGFDLQTTFRMPEDRGRQDVELVDGEDAPLAILTFASAATIRRINRGLRRRRDEAEIGFLIDPRTGRWRGKSAGEGEDDASPLDQTQRITPVVEDRKNALLLRLPASFRQVAGDEIDQVMVTLQHALVRGIQAAFQLEEGEILAEPTPNRKERNAILFYEAAEGGAGALGRLVQEFDQCRAVTREALRAMHFTETSIDLALASDAAALEDVDGTKCVAGCYQCLLSYYNQPDHAEIDRRLPVLREFLVRLSNASFATVGTATDLAPTSGLPPFDAEPLRVGDRLISMVWRKHRVAALEADWATDGALEALADMGFEAVVLPHEGAARHATLEALAARLGAA